MTNKSSEKLTISYSVGQEIQRVQSTLKKLSWYEEHGYRPHLPGGIMASSKEADVIEAVQREYSETDYVGSAARLLDEWKSLPDGFEKMRKEPSLHLADKYEIVLTKYGVGGSYNPELNQVIIKINTTAQVSRIAVVVHEIVHMCIQQLIDHYHVEHWRKERLVDLLMERYFPGIKKPQDIKEDVSVVDQAFEKYFPNIEQVAQSIGIMK